jgi:TetR/AcrR family transcriptional repressor of lmrAB and yxaGH operons
MDARLLMDESPRERMVAAAIQGMRGSGLAGAGINQVIAASGAPKGSLYHYFPGGKNQLAQEALERFGEERRAALAKLAQSAADPPARLRRLFGGLAKALEKEDFTYGCAVAGVALDLQEDSAPLAAVCAAQMDLWVEALEPAFAPLSAPRRLAWARLVIATFEGALVQARALRSAQPVLEAGELLAGAVRLEIETH